MQLFGRGNSITGDWAAERRRKGGNREATGAHYGLAAFRPTNGSRGKHGTVGEKREGSSTEGKNTCERKREQTGEKRKLNDRQVTWSPSRGL